jgi:hypothetical protein
LEKSIGAYNVTHNFKSALVFDLPFGKGKRLLSTGIAGVVLGNWRMSAINFYSSGTPIGLATTLVTRSGASGAIHHLHGVATSWAHGSLIRRSTGSLSPTAAIPSQTGAGDALSGHQTTRFNPKVGCSRISGELFLAKSIPIRESLRLDFRAEAFNIFNRVRFGTGSTSLQSQTFGLLTSNSDILNLPRQLQFGLKLYF